MNVLKKLFKLFMFILCLPIIASIIVKPDRAENSDDKSDTDVIKLPFTVIIEDDKGTYEYAPEDIIPYMMNAMIPWDILAELDDTVNPEAKRREYLKAISIVCRTNLIYTWERQGRPERFDLYGSGLYMKSCDSAFEFEEAKSAANETLGAVITDADSDRRAVIAAPFYTTSEWDMALGIAGEGDGLSINYAVELAKEGKDFYYILSLFYKNARINILNGN